MFQNKNVIAIIPARGGSKGIHHKNIVPLRGKPIIAYTIEEARKSKYVDRVIVSTDDREIAKIAGRYGAEIPFLRPKKLAKDTSPSLLVVLHALDYLEKKEKYSPDIIVFLQPTSPFRKAKHIDAAIEKIKGVDAVAGVCEVKHHPYSMMREEKGYLKPYLRIKDRPLRRQEFPKLYVLNASLYVAKREYFSKAKKTDPVAPIFEGKVKGIIMEEISSFDINKPLDLSLAHAMLKLKEAKDCDKRNQNWQ